MNIEYGYCHCGCGQKTKLAKRGDKRFGHVKNDPMRFILGHNIESGKNSPNWRGGRHIVRHSNTSYVMISMPNHPRSNYRGYAYEHIRVVEKALGFPLPECAVVHHIDGNGLNNELNNLMVFKNNIDHLKFHVKQA